MMTEDQKKIKRYVNRLEWKLKLPLELKVRISGDIGTEIHSRMESGQTVDEALGEMGTPEEVAERFNREFAGSAVRKNPARYLFLIIAAVILAGAVGYAVERYMAQKELEEAAANVIGGADGPTSIFLTDHGTGTAGYWISSAGLVCACLSAFFLASYGRRAASRKYRKCITLSAAGFVLNLIPFVFTLGAPYLSWVFPVGTTVVELDPGLTANLVTLILSVRWWRRGRPKDRPGGKECDVG